MGHDNVVFGDKLLTRLHELGVIPLYTRRVVLDIPFDGVVMMYVESFADKRILKLDATNFEDIQVCFADKDEEGD